MHANGAVDILLNDSFIVVNLQLDSWGKDTKKSKPGKVLRSVSFQVLYSFRHLARSFTTNRFYLIVKFDRFA